MTSAYQYKVMIEAVPSPNPGFNVSMTIPSSEDVATSVAAQAATTDGVILQIRPSTKTGDFSGLAAYLAEAANYPNINAVYLYDELFYADGQIQIGLYANEVLTAAAQCRAAGYYSAVSMLPEVILDANFQYPAANLNMIDVIAIDIYPSCGVNWSLADGCTYSTNLYTNMLYLSITKLRALGFTGQIWYIYQGFTIAGEVVDANKFSLQRDTIAAAPAMGVTGLIPYAYKWFPGLEPNILPGYSPIQSLADGSSF